jgi:hypothetical protein
MPPGLGRGGCWEVPPRVKLNISPLPALVTTDRGEERLGFYADSRCKIKRLRNDHHWIHIADRSPIDADRMNRSFQDRLSWVVYRVGKGVRVYRGPPFWLKTALSLSSLIAAD